MKKLPLYAKILIGMGLGLVWGLVAINTGLSDFTVDWVKPWGTIFVNMLKLIAVPLILVSLIDGVSNLSDLTKLSRIGGKTIGFYIASTMFAATVGLFAVNLTEPGKIFPEDKRQELQEKYASDVASREESAADQKDSGPLQIVVDIVPSNIFSSLGNNRAMLQIIFFSIMFGLALVMIPKEKAKPVKAFFEGANAVILKIVDFIMAFAPIGVFALIAGLIVDIAGDDKSGAMDLLAALGGFSLVTLAGLAFMIFLFYPVIISLATKIGYLQFLKGIFPAQILAFSTSSSAATLPVTMRQVEKKLGVSEEVSSFVLPLGATINMDGTSVHQAVSAVFIAQAFGLELSLVDQITIVLTATLSSIGAAAVPGAGTIMLIIVLGAIGLDASGVALILAVDRPLDMCRTIVNITGDSTVATLVASTEGELSDGLHDVEAEEAGAETLLDKKE